MSRRRQLFTSAESPVPGTGLGSLVLDAAFLVRGQGGDQGQRVCGTEAGALYLGQADPGLGTKKSCGWSHRENAPQGAIYQSESPPSPCPASASIPWVKACTALMGAAAVNQAVP